MSKFTETDFRVKELPEFYYETLDKVEWKIGSPESSFIFTVPQGYIFDVSVPFWLRWMFSPRNPRYLKPAALHDKMLEEGWSRLTAGAEFHNALQANDVPVVERLLMWFFVSLWRYGKKPLPSKYGQKES